MSHPPLEVHKYVSLVTFRKSGATVPTPVWFVLEGGRLYVWTIRTSGKIKRIKNNPKVTFAPCKMDGEPLGPYMDGVASISVDDSSEELNSKFRSKYGILFTLDKFVTRVSGKQRVFVEVRADALRQEIA